MFLRLSKIFAGIILFVVLTVASQIGGVVFVFTLLISTFIKKKLFAKKLILFVVLYALSNLFIVPPLSKKLSHRVPIVESEKVRVHSIFTKILNRNYVKPELNQVLENASKELSTNLEITCLDANFPFISGFPLLPHLSHNDGKKLDISLIYENDIGEISQKKKSFSGYGAFTEPLKNEFNQTTTCKEKGHFQYDYPKYLTFGKVNHDLKFSKKGTTELLNAILKQPQVQKVFIEPHLKARTKLSNKKIRFHGCGAVRHDDHIHIQIN